MVPLATPQQKAHCHQCYHVINATANIDPPPHAQGAVLVTLKKAAALPCADSNGLSDPYVKMHLDEQKRHSTTVRRSLTPTWNEKFEWLQARAAS